MTHFQQLASRTAFVTVADRLCCLRSLLFIMALIDKVPGDLKLYIGGYVTPSHA